MLQCGRTKDGTLLQASGLLLQVSGPLQRRVRGSVHVAIAPRGSATLGKWALEACHGQEETEQ